MTSLSDMFKMQLGGFPPPAPAMDVAHTTPMTNVQRTLPNGGGSFFSPAPAQPTAPVKIASAPIFTGGGSSTSVSSPQQPVNPEYIKPDGSYYTAQEVVANRVAKMQGPDIPRYAGDSLTEGPQTTAQLETTAAGLNNARNDIATGTTDPYKAATGSGVAYSPAELKAIESAYAGVYDPAINSALAKLQLKQTQDAAAITMQNDAQKAYQSFLYSAKLKGIPTYVQTIDGSFSPTQTNSGAATAGMNVSDFTALPTDVKNFFVNMPKVKDNTTGVTDTADNILKGEIAKVKSGDYSADQLAQDIKDMNLSPQVQAYYTSMIPATSTTQSKGWFQSILDAVTGNS